MPPRKPDTQSDPFRGLERWLGFPSPLVQDHPGLYLEPALHHPPIAETYPLRQDRIVQEIKLSK